MGDIANIALRIATKIITDLRIMGILSFVTNSKVQSPGHSLYLSVPTPYAVTSESCQGRALERLSAELC